MERRDFFRLMLGAAALLPPSQVWPFRKIFIPSHVGLGLGLFDVVPQLTTQWITLATPGNFRPGDRVQIYRHVRGLPEYYLVKETDALGIRVVADFSPPSGQWMNLDRKPLRTPLQVPLRSPWKKS